MNIDNVFTVAFTDEPPLTTRVPRGEIWIDPQVLRSQWLPNSAEGVVRISSQIGSDLCFFSCTGFQPIPLKNKLLKEAVSLGKLSGLTCGAVIDGPWQRLTGTEDTLRMLLWLKKEPDLLEEKLNLTLLNIYKEMEAWKEAGIDLLLIADDIAHSSGPYFSPEHFNQILLPLYDRFLSLNATNSPVYVGFHSDGDLSLLLPSLIKIGFTFFSLEPEAMDLLNVWQTYGRQVLIMSGIRASWLTIQTFDYTDKNNFKRVIPILIGRGKLILSSTCGLFHPPSIEKIKEIYSYVSSLQS